MENVRAELMKGIETARGYGMELRPGILAWDGEQCCVLGAYLIDQSVICAGDTVLPGSSEELELRNRAAELLGITQYQACSISQGFDMPTELLESPWIRLGAELRRATHEVGHVLNGATEIQEDDGEATMGPGATGRACLGDA